MNILLKHNSNKHSSQFVLDNGEVVVCVLNLYNNIFDEYFRNLLKI